MLATKKYELAGYSQIENRDDQLFIRMIVVHSHYQRNGVGKKLLESVITEANQQSKKIGLEVFKINKVAKAFYENHGFKVVGETLSSLIMAHS